MSWLFNAAVEINSKVIKYKYCIPLYLPVALIPAKCLLMSNITFDDEVMDYRGSYLDIVNRASINFNTGNLRNAVNSYGCFSDAWIGIPYFSGNSLGATFRIKFKFSVCENDVRNQDFVTLIGQEAFPMDDNVPEPTMNFGYRAVDSTFRVTMATGGEIDMASDECRARIVSYCKELFHRHVNLFQKNNSV